MADRARRKSSILKVTKSNQRAPLQDVNTLSQEMKSSQEDDVTSHTANLRRRVSFAGKNFVKEFCAEAEIASVHHAVEYEQEWQASTDSSGLVMSDVSNNTHSNTGISENNSHIRFQNSAMRPSDLIDDFDISEKIMKDYLGKTPSQPKVNQPKPVRKTRFSFGEIQPHLYDDQESAPTHPPQGAKNTVVDKAPEHKQLGNVSSEETNTCIRVQTNHITHTKTVQNVQVTNTDSSRVCHNVRFQEEFVCTVEKRVGPHFQDNATSQQILTPDADENPSRSGRPRLYSSVVGSEMESLSVQNDVFTDVLQPQHQLTRKSVGFHNAVNKTVLDESEMNFTRPLPGLIECGIQISSDGFGTQANVPQDKSCIKIPSQGELVAENGDRYHEEEMDDDYDGPYTQADPCGERADEQPADVTQCMDESMELTRAVPGVIQLGFELPRAGHSVDPITNFVLPELKSVTGESSGSCHVTDSHQIEIERACSQSLQNASKTSEFKEDTKDNVQNILRNVQMGEEYISGGKKEREICSDRTLSLSTSMEFTRMLPGNIHVNIEDQNEDKETEENLNFPSHSTTQVMSTSMEFTKALPSNIHVNIEDQNEDKETEENFNFPSHSTTQVMSTSMEFTKALPSNIQCDIQEEYMNTSASEQENVRFDRTLAMNTSMEFTVALPSNIQVDFSKQVADKSGKEDNSDHNHSKTQVMCTSMDFTKMLQSNIQDGFENGQCRAVNTTEQENKSQSLLKLTIPVPSKSEEDHVGGQNNVLDATSEEIPSDNQTNVMCASMDFTRLMPSNIQDNCAGGQSPTRRLHDDIPSCNRTQALCMSMELTRPLQGHIVTTIQFNADLRGKESNSPEQEAMDVLEDHVNQNVPEDNIVVQEQSKADNQLSCNKTQILEQPVPLVCNNENNELGSSCDSSEPQNSITAHVEHKATEDASEQCQSDLPQEKQDMYLSSTDADKNRSSPGTMNYGVSPINPSVGVFGRMSFSAIGHPFQSKPLLISSPPTQSGIEAVLVQTVPSGDVDDNRLPLCNNESKSTVGEKDISLSENVASVSQGEAVCASIGTNLGTDRQTLSSETQPAQAEEQDNIPDPFKSKPCLPLSPARPPATGLLGQISQEAGIVCGTESSSSDKEAVGIKSSMALCSASDEKHCMLLDVSPPFHDVSSNNSIEVSTNVTDSCTNLLHTTIKNAEITLRQMQCPESQEGAEEVNGSGKSLEDMDCDHVPVEEISLAQSDLTTSSSKGAHSHVQSSSSNIKIIVENETEHVTRKVAKRPRVSLLDCEEPTYGNSNKVSKISVNTSSKRSHDFDLDHEEACSEDCHSSNSSKRLCNSNSDLRRSNDCGMSETAIDSDPDSVLTHSSLKDCSSKTNCSSLSIANHSSEQSLDDIIFENQRRHPQYWDAMKGGNNLWSFKFKCTELELNVNLEQSLRNHGSIVASNGRFISNVTDKTKPAIRWGMSILMDKVQSEDWNSFLRNTYNFMEVLQKIVKEVILFRKFIIQIILLEGQHNLVFTKDSLSFNITSFKCHLWFQVILKMDRWEKYTPNHISVKSIVGETRESEVKNLITGVKKDIYFLKNYIRDIKDYVKTLEQFC